MAKNTTFLGFCLTLRLKVLKNEALYMPINDFDPSGFALKNGNFIGLPFTEAEAKLILLPVPWEATVSYSAGTAQGPENIREAAYQLDLFDPDFTDAWKMGIYMRPSDPELAALSEQTRAKAKAHIDALEAGQEPDAENLAQVNALCQQMNSWVYTQTKAILDSGKLVGLVGGDHSTPLGFIKALAERHEEFGVLQIDAHMDLRQAYEGFTYSHASIFYNVLNEVPQVSKLVQVGIRDFCQEEVDNALNSQGRVSVYYDQVIKERLFEGQDYKRICEAICAYLPKKVYISFDIDGLDPKLCPNTGTPVAGGLELAEVFYLFKILLRRGHEIIGFDLNEVGSASEWDGNVGARVLYKMSNCLGRSQKLI